MLTRVLSIAILAALAGTAGAPLAHADIYTWTDARGVLNVSNLPPPDGAKVSHLVHEQPPPVAAPSDAAREAARQAEVRALSERVQQLEAEANARSAVPPDLMYARAPAPPLPPSVQYNVTVLPPEVPQYNADAAPPPGPGCDPSWLGCWAWWNTYFYPAPVAAFRTPPFQRFLPFRGEHPFHGPSHHVTNTQPIARIPGAVRKG